MLAGANIRKTRGQMVFLASLILIASTLLIVGLTVLLGFGSYFDQTAEDLNTSEARIMISEDHFSDEVEQFLRDQSSEIQINKGLMLPVELYWGDSFISEGILVYDLAENREISQWKLVDGSLAEGSGAINLPNVFRIDAGYELGDTIALEMQHQTHNFIVEGYIENVYSGGMAASHSAFVSSELFEELQDAHPEQKVKVIYANGIEDFPELQLRLTELMPDLGMGVFDVISVVDLQAIAMGRTMMAEMASIMLTIVAFIIVAVSLLVVRFKISNSIEDGISNIGSLQAIGYTNRQVSLSFVAQYGLIAATATLLSIVPAHFLLSPIADVLAGQSGLLWQPNIDLALSLLAASALTAIAIACAWLSARKVRKITPVQALRDGSSNRSFKRNPIALDRTQLPLNVALSLKTALQGIRQSAMMATILIVLSFVAAIAIILFYNSAINLTAFEQIPGIERSDAGIVFMPEEDLEVLLAEINAHEDVYFAQFFDSNLTVIGDTLTVAFTMDDFSRRVTNNIYSGSFPESENEVALSVLLADALELEVGDEIVIGDDKIPFEVVGTAQGMEGGSFFAYFTTDGMQKINPNYVPLLAHVYLNPEVDPADFIRQMEDLYGDQTIMIVDMAEIFEIGAGSFAAIFSAVGIAILVASTLVVVMVLYFVIASSIVRRSRELGIQKAIGFTTKDLMSQISMNFMLPILTGTILGTILGTLALNPLMSMGLSGMGVMTSNMIVSLGWVIGTAAVLLLLAYAISMLVTWRIRKISAYSLVTE